MLCYIHIPFCDSKCHYCSFNSYVGLFDRRERYMEALHRQLRHELERFDAAEGSIETLFIGGGTPSTIPPQLYADIFALLSPYLAPDAEITVEANPNSATSAWLDGMQALGVNRVSFGVQSFDEAKLKMLNRAHSPAQAIAAVESARKAGIEHISLDLIYNCAGDTRELLADDIATALSLPIDHISAYELTIEERTPFAAAPQMRQENDEIARFVADTITAAGFAHYEISNFGRYQSRHNQGYWKLENYIGAGAGAVGFLTDRRFYPLTDIEQYIVDPLRIAEEPITPEELRTERIFLGLRSCVGIDGSLFEEDERTKLEHLLSEGMLRFEDERYYNTDYFLADEIALYLMG